MASQHTPAHANNTNLGNVVDILKDFGFFERVVDVRRLQLATRAALVLLARRLLAGVPSSKDASRISAIGKVLCTRATPAGSVDDQGARPSISEDAPLRLMAFFSSSSFFIFSATWFNIF